MMKLISIYTVFNKKRDGGFTLLEVLVALVVISLGLAALYSALSQGTRLTSRVEERMVGNWVADNQLTQYRASFLWPKPVKETLDVNMAGRNWVIQQEITNTVDKNIRRIDISVSLEKVENEPVATLYGFFINPRPIFDDDNDNDESLNF